MTKQCPVAVQRTSQQCNYVTKLVVRLAALVARQLGRLVPLAVARGTNYRIYIWTDWRSFRRSGRPPIWCAWWVASTGCVAGVKLGETFLTTSSRVSVLVAVHEFDMSTETSSAPNSANASAILSL